MKHYTKRAERDEILAKARTIADGAKASGRMITNAEEAQIEGLLAKATQLRDEIELDESLDALASQVDLRPGASRKDSTGSDRFGRMTWKPREIKGVKLLADGSYASTAQAFLDIFPSYDGTPSRVAQIFPRMTTTDSVSKFLRLVEGSFGPESGSSWADYRQAEPLAPKQQSAITFEEDSIEAATFAAISSPISVQAASDNPRMIRDASALLIEEALEGLDYYCVEAMETAAGSPATGAGDPVSSVRRGARLLQEARIPVGGGLIALVSPAAAEAIETTRANEDGDGPYLSALAPNSAADGFWGSIRLLPTLHVSDDSHAIVVAPDSFATLMVREAPRVDTDASGDLFETNGIRLRAELRAGLAVVREAACVSVSLA